MIIIPSFRGLVARVFTEESGPESGSLYAWGNHGEFNVPLTGQLGIGNNNNNRSSPVLINSSTGFYGSVSGWTKVSSGWKHSLGINSGKLYSWGGNGKGQLGIGTFTTYFPSDNNNKSSPIQIGTGANWTAVSAGGSHSLALKSDGTLWSWGYNFHGQLGLGNTTSLSSPVQVGGSDWSSVSAGYNHSLAIKTDGTLWAWGRNSYGQLGLENTTDHSSPVQVGTGIDWASVSAGGAYFSGGHSLATKNDGTLWSWGYNNAGQLGLGDYGYGTYRSSPVQVGGSDWSSVSAGGQHSLAIKTTNSLWAWGKNNYGQLGLGDTVDRSAPSQITGSNWKMASAGYRHSGGIDISDKMFFWGRNNNGQVGDNSTTNRSSPVPIMSSSNWLYIASMKDNSSFAIKKQT